MTKALGLSQPNSLVPEAACVAERPSAPFSIHCPETRDPWEMLAVHRGSVVRFLKRKCRDVHQAEDLAHDALIKAARYRRALRHVARPGAWVMQIAVNLQRDLVRKESRQRLMPPETELFNAVPGTEPIPGENEPGLLYEIEGRAFDQCDIVSEIRGVWGALSRQDRMVLSGYYREGGSTQLAAANCGVDRSLVKIRLFRARKRLEAQLRRRLAAR